MIRILLATILLASMGSAQELTSTGTLCDPYNGQIAYVSSTSGPYCCYEMFEPTLTTPTDCQNYCASNSYFSMYGYFRNNTYDTCVCLGCPGSTGPQLNWEVEQTRTADVQDLASSATFDVEASLNTNSSTQLTLAANKTAVIRTNTLVNGNRIQFIAIPSVTGLSPSSTLAFTVRDLMDYGRSIEAAMFRNNSFEISNLAQRYNPAVQYKRQVSPSDLFTYTMRNLGNQIFVVLSSGTQPLASWNYEPVASNTDSTIVTLANDFTFNLDVETSAAMVYESCDLTNCNNNVLEVCENNNILDRKYCPLGCNIPAKDCLKCNSTNCQGTCSADSVCVCSDTQLGSSCEHDLSVDTFYLVGTVQSGPFPTPFQMKLAACTVGNVCGTVSYVIPTLSFGITVTGSCCTAKLRLTDMTGVNSTRTLQLVTDNEWSCRQGDLPMDPKSFDTAYEITVQAVGGNNYNPNSGLNWQLGGNSISGSAEEQSQLTCDATESSESSNAQILAVVEPVAITFLVVCCVGVAGGFVGGFFKSPPRLTVKKRNFKGCLPKGNAALSRSIIAIVCVDVGIVTTMNLIGALIPISGMVLLSGILLAIMVFQYEAVASRFNNKFRQIYQLQKVERVFGRLGAAFLIIVGFFLIVATVIQSLELPSFFSIISTLFAGVVGYFYLALFITWIFVAVHFAGAIYISVCYYYTAARTEEQESIEEDSDKEEIEFNDRKENKVEPEA